MGLSCGFSQLLQLCEQFSNALTRIFKLLEFFRSRLGQCGLFEILRLLGQEQAQLKTDMRFVMDSRCVRSVRNDRRG
jgi:hypothetical protein